MKKNTLPAIYFVLICSVTGTAQIKSHLIDLKHKLPQNHPKEQFSPVLDFFSGVPASDRNLLVAEKLRFDELPPFDNSISVSKEPRVVMLRDNGMPMWIKGLPTDAESTKHLPIKQQCKLYLEACKKVLQVNQPDQEFILGQEEQDAQGNWHIRINQQLEGIPVYGAELILHTKSGQVYMVNGNSFPTPQLETLVPKISQKEALSIAKNEFSNIKSLNTFELSMLPEPQENAELVIYHPDGKTDAEQLVWKISLYPNIASHWQLMIDAISGEILLKYEQLCKLDHHYHPKFNLCESGFGLATNDAAFRVREISTTTLADGPRVANATDLLGVSRNINTYESGNAFFMIDASRDMFNVQSSVFPDDPSGVIWTIDALNTSPENNNFNANHVISTNNTWNVPASVSAHYNGGQAFQYFRNTHNRQSINNKKGNIVSFINVAEKDGSSMDNAFWNGKAIFYGNGNQRFRPLARGLDVAAHEMTHGVIETTAGLEYLNESGALNESFADIFGVMVDRDDWNVGEDVARPAFYPSGTMRSMSNPHNGGNQIGDPGYQPKHYNERYQGVEDNGGVHINSGITNHAFYLFATSPGVTKEIAERVYYQALTKYLVRSSQFVDLRVAVVQAATDLHGANSGVVNAARAALDAVGIPGGGGGNYQRDLPPNPGVRRMLLTDVDQLAIYLALEDGTIAGNPLIDFGILSRFSITDNGAFAVFVGEDKKMYVIDFRSNNYQVLSSDPIWRNVAIAKDGSKIAAITDDFDNIVSVYDFASQRWNHFELYNPTYSTGAVTGDVQYADVLEWDYSGEWVMYDALNAIGSVFGDIEYWDIGFLNVWNNGTRNFGDGTVSKLYSGLPENVSVGNPSFSKNSPYIFAFDYIDEFNEDYYLVAANFEIGDLSDPAIFVNSDLNFPNYAIDDKRITFDAFNTSGQPVLASIGLATNKLNPSGSATIFITGGRWGVWYADGTRTIPTTEIDASASLKVSPNPFTDQIIIETELPVTAEVRIHVFDLLGHMVFSAHSSDQRVELDLSNLSQGQYLLQWQSENLLATQRIVKF